MEIVHKNIPFGCPTPMGGGLYLLKMPLPFRLDHINLYLIDDGDGWILVDTGLNHRSVRERWEALRHDFFGKQPLKKIVLTHLHPDHIGHAAWLQQQYDVEVHISEGDWAMAQRLWQSPSETAIPAYEAHYRAFGVAGGLFDELVANRGSYRRLVKELPERVRLLAPGENVDAAGRWQTVAGSGHSPEHLCLWNSESGQFITGDHILPTITPNISVMVAGVANPLDNYLASLDDFAKIPCEIYFPAHGQPSRNYPARVAAIKSHHQDKLRILLEGCNVPLTVIEALPLLFEKELPSQQYMFALGETAAHLCYLENKRLLTRTGDDVWYFHAAEVAAYSPEPEAYRAL